MATWVIWTPEGLFSLSSVFQSWCLWQAGSAGSREVLARHTLLKTSWKGTITKEPWQLWDMVLAEVVSSGCAELPQKVTDASRGLSGTPKVAQCDWEKKKNNFA